MDIQGFANALEKLKDFLHSIRYSTNADLGSLKIYSYILSDSIVLVLGCKVLNGKLQLLHNNLKWFLGTCSMVMGISMTKNFPLRGAIGAGNFYMNDGIMISDGLINAHNYETKQEWYGAVLTPEALALIEKEHIDISSDDFSNFIKYGKIPWKEFSKENNDIQILPPEESYFIKPHFYNHNWKSYLPEYFNKKDRIRNSDCLYSTMNSVSSIS